MKYWKDKITDHFNKILLAMLFIGTVALCVHLMHKSDAGGDEAGMIVWAETQAAFILGKLLGMMPADKPEQPANTATETKTITTATSPDPITKETT